jgi:signal transduction histidine kinase
MAAVVAHEVRNPLAGIKGAMQVLAARREEGDPEAPVMRDIVSRVDSLSELINDLLLFARPTPPRMAKMGIRPVLDDAAAMARRDPAAAQVEIAVSACDAVIDGDYELVKALFLNLFLNSAQAMQGRGRIEVTATARGGDVRIAVRDFGPGIPDAVAAQMFEPFFTTKTRGGGLGLAIARRTAELHGGSLTHDKPVDGGAEMIVTLACRALVIDPAARIADEHGE